MTQAASGHHILAGQRVGGVVERIGRHAVESRHVVDDERGVVEERFAASDRLLDRREAPVLGTGGLPGRVDREDRIGERRTQWIIDPDREGWRHRVLQVIGTAIGSFEIQQRNADIGHEDDLRCGQAHLEVDDILLRLSTDDRCALRVGRGG